MSHEIRTSRGKQGGFADRALAERVLRRLCVGAIIEGIRFGPILQVLLANDDWRGKPIPGQVYLNLESKWTTFPSRPPRFPDSEDDLPDVSDDDQVRVLCRLRLRKIAAVELGQAAPHLLLTLEDGSMFFVNGRHEMYECWQLGVCYAEPPNAWLVVACPGGDVAVWAPPDVTSAK